MDFVELFGVLMPGEVGISLVLEIAVAVLLALALFMAATHRGAYHHWIMLSAFLLDELIAKPIMVQRFTLGVFGDFPYSYTSGFAHILLSVVCTVSGIVAIYLGFRYRVKKDRKMFMPPKGQVHKIAGAVFYASWYLAFLLGLRVFLLFYV